MKRAWLLFFLVPMILLAAIINGYQDYVLIASPGVPASGRARLYVDSSTNLLTCLLNSSASCMPSVLFQTGGTNNSSQTSLNLSGSGSVTVTNPSAGNVTIAGPNFQTNSSNNSTQTTLNLVAGNGMTLTNSGSQVTIAGPTFQTNSSNNSTQTALNLIAGTNITLTNSGSGVTIAASGGGGGGALTQISQQVLSGAAASVTFSGISGSYSALKLELIARSSTSAVGDDIQIEFNSDTGNHYNRMSAFFTSSGNGSNDALATSPVPVCTIAAASNTSNIPGQCVIDIVGYAQTTFNKTGFAASSTPGGQTAGAGSLTVGFRWDSTAAITSIILKPASAANFVTGSIFTLYGLQ